MYQQKLDAVRRIIEQHNQNVEGDSIVDVEEFFTKLRQIGGTTDEALTKCDWGDIQSCGKTSLPILLAKQIADAFRKKIDTRPKAVTEKRALSMSLEELLENYDARDSENPIGQRLAQLGKGLPFLCFNVDNSVNVQASLQCIDDIREGFEPRTMTIVDGVPQKLYKLGERPDSVMDENPLYAGRALRGSEQFCDQTNRSWKGVPSRARAILQLALKASTELRIDQLTDAHNIMDLMVGKTPEQVILVLSSRFPLAALRYAELEKVGALPTLKLIRNSGSRKQDPFYGNKTY